MPKGTWLELMRAAQQPNIASSLAFVQSIFPTIPGSEFAKNTFNPIRQLLEVLQVRPNPNKPLLKLHIGDPTLTGNLKHHPSATEGIRRALQSNDCDGYPPAYGLTRAREAVAEKFSTRLNQISPEDVTMTSGCSHALQIAVEVLGNAGQNMLMPNPGYPIGELLMRPLGIEPRGYRLQMDNNWEIDLEHMQSLIDENTVAITVNNPSNPLGAVYSKHHLQQILSIAEYYRLPIIADEIYGTLTYDGAEFHPLSSLEPKVPVLTCDGVGKRYLVPGWRMGWLIVNDHQDAFKDVRIKIRQLAQKINGPSALIQGAIPYMLFNTPQSFFDNIVNLLSKNSHIIQTKLATLPGIRPIRAYGAMYTMVAIDMAYFPHFPTETDLIKALISEESLYVLPASMFGSTGSVRLVISHPSEIIEDACDRLAKFALRHAIEPPVEYQSQSQFYGKAVVTDF